MNDFHGLPVSSLCSDHLRLDYLTSAGPRIVGLWLEGDSENLLAETPDISWETPNGVFHLVGGHRLWVAPENLENTSAPDEAPLAIQKDRYSVELKAPPHPATGLSKSIAIRLAPDRPAVTLEHCIQNHNPFTVELAPWAITMLPLGGLAGLPQPGLFDGLLPNRKLVLWPYTNLRDPRLHFEDDLIVLKALADEKPCKIGAHNPAGWLFYACPDRVFIKHSAFQGDASYPDWGCNAELYVRDRFIELETLGPLVQLEPGAFTLHQESWHVIRLDSAPLTIDNLRKVTGIIQSVLGV